MHANGTVFTLCFTAVAISPGHKIRLTVSLVSRITQFLPSQATVWKSVSKRWSSSESMKPFSEWPVSQLKYSWIHRASTAVPSRTFSLGGVRGECVT